MGAELRGVVVRLLDNWIAEEGRGGSGRNEGTEKLNRIANVAVEPKARLLELDRVLL